MASMNTVLVMGNLTREVELRYTQQGKPVAEISIAINRKTGEHEDVCYLKVVAWGKTAENCQRYLGKGSCVFVEGYLKQENWEDRQTGQKRSSMCVVAEKIQFISSPRNATNDAPATQQGGYDRSAYQSSQSRQRRGRFYGDPSYSSGNGGGHVYGREDLPAAQSPAPTEHDQAKANGYQPQPPDPAPVQTPAEPPEINDDIPF